MDRAYFHVDSVIELYNFSLPLYNKYAKELFFPPEINNIIMDYVKCSIWIPNGYHKDRLISMINLKYSGMNIYTNCTYEYSLWLRLNIITHQLRLLNGQSFYRSAFYDEDLRLMYKYICSIYPSFRYLCEKSNGIYFEKTKKLIIKRNNMHKKIVKKMINQRGNVIYEMGIKIKHDLILIPSNFSLTNIDDTLTKEEKKEMFSLINPSHSNIKNYVLLQLCMYKLNEGGKCVIPLTEYIEQEYIRKYLVNNFILEKVVEIKEEEEDFLLYLIFRKPLINEKNKGHVEFAIAQGKGLYSEKSKVRVTHEVIINNNYILIPKYYLCLRDINKLAKPTSILLRELFKMNKAFIKTVYLLIRDGDIYNSFNYAEFFSSAELLRDLNFPLMNIYISLISIRYKLREITGLEYFMNPILLKQNPFNYEQERIIGSIPVL